MNKIISKRRLGYGVFEFWIENPNISKKSLPGQFVVLKINESGERIPLTVADAKDNMFRIVVKAVGKTTYELCRLNEGDTIQSVSGPLGRPSEIEKYGKVLIIGGGIGIAAILPIAKALKNIGNNVTVVLGARTSDQLILKDEFDFADRLILSTDDGSVGVKGNVAQVMEELLEKEKFDIAWAVGPAVMMKACSLIAKKKDLLIYVSLNSIMIDATGMCGGCRAVIDNQIKYVCVDGPEFDGRKVDWDVFISRLNQYRDLERIALERYLEKVGEPKWL